MDRKEIKILDHGYVSYIDHMGEEERIIEAARQSTQKGFLGWEGTQACKSCGFEVGDFPKVKMKDIPIDQIQNVSCVHEFEYRKGDKHLLEYLYKNKHMTPFEMCELTIQVKAPIMVFREWHRHRTQSYNEMSGRYIQMPNEHYIPEVRMQDKKNRQGSFTSEDFGNAINSDFRSNITFQQDQIYAQYEVDINAGIAKEVARINTPISRYSVMYAKANLRNWLGFLDLRTRPNAQWEIVQYANAVAGIIKELWPRTYVLYEEYTRYSCSLSATEIRLLINNLEFQVRDVGEEPAVRDILKRLKESQK